VVSLLSSHCGVLKIVVNVAQSDKLFTCHISSLVVAPSPLLVFIIMVVVGVGVVGSGGVSVWVVGGQCRWLPCMWWWWEEKGGGLLMPNRASGYADILSRKAATPLVCVA